MDSSASVLLAFTNLAKLRSSNVAPGADLLTSILGLRQEGPDEEGGRQEAGAYGRVEGHREGARLCWPEKEDYERGICCAEGT